MKKIALFLSFVVFCSTATVKVVAQDKKVPGTESKKPDAQKEQKKVAPQTKKEEQKPAPVTHKKKPAKHHKHHKEIKPEPKK